MIGAMIDRIRPTMTITITTSPTAVATSTTSTRHATPERKAQEEVGKQRDRPDERGHEQGEANVQALRTWAAFMANDAPSPAIELLKESSRHRNAGMLRIATRGKRVRCGVLDEEHRGMVQVCRDDHLVHDIY